MNKVLIKGAFVALAVFGCAAQSNAQYYEIASQLPNLISPALTGGSSYKGFVEASGLAGIGTNRANFLGVSTTQGFQYNNWFFMGAGVGIDVAMAHSRDDDSALPPDSYPSYWRHEGSQTKVVVPVFSDFRFNIGDRTSTSFFIDIKLGAAWLLGSSYLVMDDARLTTATQFYFRPSVGVRIPVSKSNNRNAFNIGITYQLLTSNNNYSWTDRSVSLNNVGLTLGYEW